METNKKSHSKNFDISVVITAYNRREFLSSAIESVLKQEIAGPRIEIIVISNLDFRTDGIPQNFNLKKIIMEGTMGEFLSVGIKSASGEIIAFLDDDDIWMPNRMERLESVFSDINVIFYHSMYSYIDSGGKPIEYVRNVEKNDFDAFSAPLILYDAKNSKHIRKAIAWRADFNLSCIAVRKKLAMEYIDTLKLITSAPDGFFFWTAVMSGGNLFIDNLKLTGYRVHQLNISGYRNHEYKQRELSREIYTFGLLKTLTNSHEIVEWLQLYEAEYYVLMLTFGRTKSVLITKSIFNLAKTGFRITNAMKYRVLIFAFLGILNRNFPLLIYDHIRRKC
ncbi:MAG: glycosyltransferase [Thermoplasmatales archaeon]